MSSPIDARFNRRRSRHLAGRLALVLGVVSTTRTAPPSGSSQQQQQQCGPMTAPTLLPQASAFVPPSSSTAAVSSHRTGTIHRRTVPLVLKDPTEVGGDRTAGGSGDGYPGENQAPAGRSSGSGPENSCYASVSISSDGAASSAPAVPVIELEGREEYLNREFANGLILGSEEGFWNNSGLSAGGGATKPLLEEEEVLVASLEEDEGSTVTSSGPVLDGDLSPCLAEHGAAERLFIETVVKEGDNNIVRVEGIPTLSLEEEEALSAPVKDDKADASSSSTTTPTPSTSTQYQIPTLSQIVKFALPATAIYLCDPLLSLIDTASVGLLAKSTAHQAALSPAIAVVNYSALLLAFLFVGATNFVAQAAARVGPGAGSGDVETAGKDQEESAAAAGPAQILLSTLQISLHTGTLLGVVLFALAPTLIGLLSGRGALPPEVFRPAVQYVRIRALGFPAAAVLGSAQAACLGLKDTTTPLLVLGAAAVLNVVGDLSLVGVTSNRWLYGAAGAAWATTIGQVAAVGLFLELLKARPRGNNGNGNDDTVDASGVGSGGRLGLTRMFSRRRSSTQTAGGGADTTAELPPSRASADAGGAISARGFLAEHNFEPHHILRLPPRSTVKQFLPYVVPVTTTSVGRVSLFLSMAHVVSSCMGVVGMAAQTIALGIFDALCPLSQSLTLAAQAFVPGALEEQDRLRQAARGEAEAAGTSAEQEKSRDVLAKFSRQFLKAGGAFGLFTALCATSIPFVSSLMTTDAAVVSQIVAVMPQLAAIFALHGLVMSAEGVLLGKEDVNFLGCMYGAFFFIMPAWMMRVKHGALNLGKAAGLGSVWSVFLMYQLMRSILWAGRAAMPTKDR